MPTVPRRPAAQQERDRLQARRLQAAKLFAAGVTQAEVARQLECLPLRPPAPGMPAGGCGGADRPATADGPTGPTATRCRTPSSPPSSRPCSKGAGRRRVRRRAVDLGPHRPGDPAADRGRATIPAHVWALLRHRLGWDGPAATSAALTERDQAAIHRWVAARLAAGSSKRRTAPRRGDLVFFDESALEPHDPNVRRAPRRRSGQPPVPDPPVRPGRRASMAAAHLLRRARRRRPPLPFTCRPGGLRHRQP